MLVGTAYVVRVPIVCNARCESSARFMLRRNAARASAQAIRLCLCVCINSGKVVYIVSRGSLALRGVRTGRIGPTQT